MFIWSWNSLPLLEPKLSLLSSYESPTEHSLPVESSLDLFVGCFQPTGDILPIFEIMTHSKARFRYFIFVFCIKLFIVIVYFCCRKGLRLLENWLLECESEEDNWGIQQLLGCWAKQWENTQNMGLSWQHSAGYKQIRLWEKKIILFLVL